MNGVLLLGPGVRERFEADLQQFGYATHAPPHAATIDDVGEAILELKRQAFGGIGAIAVGPAATLLLEAATVLPQLDGIVLFDVRVPAARPHYARMRAQILIHRAEQGSAMTADEVERLHEEARPGRVQIFDWSYPTANERFAIDPGTDADAIEAEIAWDRTRDFLTTALPELPSV